MKTLKTMMLGLVITLTFGAAKAASPDPRNERLTVNYAVKTYVNAMVHGQFSGIDEVIDNNAKFSMLRGKQMLSFTKAQILESFKGNENVEQDCITSASISESNADITIVKVNMKYTNFTRINYVTMANTSEGWKITNIYSVFK